MHSRGMRLISAIGRSLPASSSPSRIRYSRRRYLDGFARVFGTIWPTSYYMHASVGAFTKGLGAEGLWVDALALAAFIPVLIGLSVAGLPRQET